MHVYVFSTTTGFLNPVLLTFRAGYFCFQKFSCLSQEVQQYPGLPPDARIIPLLVTTKDVSRCCQTSPEGGGWTVKLPCPRTSEKVSRFQNIRKIRFSTQRQNDDYNLLPKCCSVQTNHPCLQLYTTALSLLVIYSTVTGAQHSALFTQQVLNNAQFFQVELWLIHNISCVQPSDSVIYKCIYVYIHTHI